MMSADKDYLSLSLREMLDDTAAKSATPGGGSVAALVGALSCSLARMALQFTIGKPQYAEHERQLQEILGDLQQAGEQFTRLMTEDMRAYQAVRDARKADQATKDAAAARAAAVPMDIVGLSESVAACLDELKSFVNPNLISDLRAAAVLAEAAARTAGCTVRDNLPTMPDREQAGRLERQLEALIHEAARHAEAVVGYRGDKG